MSVVSPKLFLLLLLTLLIAFLANPFDPNKKYSSSKFWKSATLESVSEIPKEVLSPGNTNGPVLMWAAGITDDVRIISALVDRGADVNDADPIFLGTPLTAAASDNPNTKIIDELMKLGADINKTVNNNEDALMLAARFNNNPQIIETLFSHGANIKHKNDDGKTALDLAISHGNSVAENALRKLMKK